MSKIRSSGAAIGAAIRPSLPTVVGSTPTDVPVEQVPLRSPAPNIGQSAGQPISLRRAPILSGVSAPSEATTQQMDLLRRAAAGQATMDASAMILDVEPAPLHATPEQQIDHMMRLVARLVSLHDTVRFARSGGVHV